jgi:hypothetical protein
MTLGAASVIIAPVAAFLSAAALPNPPGNGPGAGQIIIGFLVPVAVVGFAAVITRARPAEAAFWAFMGLAATGGLILLVLWAVFAATGGQ